MWENFIVKQKQMTVQEIDEELGLLSSRITTLQAIKFQIKKAQDPSLLQYHKTATQALVLKMILDSRKVGLTTLEVSQHLKVLNQEKSGSNVREVISRLKKLKKIKVKKGSNAKNPTYIIYRKPNQ